MPQTVAEYKEPALNAAKLGALIYTVDNAPPLLTRLFNLRLLRAQREQNLAALRALPCTCNTDYDSNSTIDPLNTNSNHVFPQEMLMKIFSYMLCPDLCHSALVCKVWHEATQVEYLWSDMYIGLMKYYTYQHSQTFFAKQGKNVGFGSRGFHSRSTDKHVQLYGLLNKQYPNKVTFIAEYMHRMPKQSMSVPEATLLEIELGALGIANDEFETILENNSFAKIFMLPLTVRYNYTNYIVSFWVMQCILFIGI